MTEPEEMLSVLDDLGRATAKVHCVSDTDSEHTLVGFQVEDAIGSVIGADDAAFVTAMVAFGTQYAEVVRADHALFVDAFRNYQIPGL